MTRTATAPRRPAPPAWSSKPSTTRQRSLFPVKHCDPVGCSEQTWKLKYGAPETTTDLNGQITSYGYDAYGRQTKVTNPDGGTSSTAYRDEGGWQGPDSQRQRVRTDVSDGSKGDGVLWQEQLLDGLGRVYKTIREGDGSGAIVSQTRFADASERPVVSVDPHVGCCGAWTEYRYDGAHPAHRDDPARRCHLRDRVPSRRHAHARPELAELPLEDWERVLRVNLTGVFLCMKYELSEMVPRGAGAIVNTSSSAGLYALPGMPAYVASKHGLVGLCKAAAVDYGQYGIRVNCLCPQLHTHADVRIGRLRDRPRRGARHGDPARPACAGGRDRRGRGMALRGRGVVRHRAHHVP
jgi:YD repeat-containing protein